ncbi:hypothetical protein H7J07_06050 [Mycobacterium koreense]|uniref:Uncharacterized protein n=1 Tax=Mycolicibacillus koreensis TaxID=1069220 RepID=A0A7I7SDZ3_9MYCO|nr:hypothetical protein [Mycolicibacillus koreensis]MCV7247789.1 hypothetical protein [Mycolicibacillus koreensis]OSC34695.1 hypothetical protein B8W67_05455 [Mycolicibacillus koreensis]BBY54175.1 hypothetical protein MKOR_14260 [Mycolicibacillus koreensis]
MPQEIRLTPELLPLVGAVTARDKHRKRDDDDDAEHSDELTAAIDGVSWSAWIAGDPRVVGTGSVDECGCAIAHWHTAENSKSVTLHDGCERGYGAHIWSGTMRADLDVNEHVSRLRLSAALHGVSERDAAAVHGIELRRRSSLHVLTPESVEDSAAELEAKGNLAAADHRRRVAAEMRRAVAMRNGEAAAPTYRVAGGPESHAAGTDGPSGSQTGGQDSGDGDGRKEAVPLDELFAELPDPYDSELEARVFGFLPETQRIREAARGGAISPWSVLGITIGRGLLRVAPDVLIPPLVGNTPAVLNLQIGIVGASGKGKGASVGVVDYSASVDQGWDKRFKPPSGPALANLFVQLSRDDAGEPYIEQIRDAAWCDWPEVDSLTATVKRGGNDLGSELRSGITGEELGTDPKGERQHPLKVPARSYRLLVTVSVQYGEPAAPLMAERDGGTLQRTIWFGTADPGRYTTWDASRPTWTQLDIMAQLPPGQQQLTVDEDIRREVWEAQSASIDSDCAGDELGGHHNLNRLKLAAWAVLVQHRHHIDRAAWEWAGAVMTHSSRIQARLDASVKNLRRSQARESGELDHVRRTAQGEAAAKQWERLLDNLARWGHKQSAWFTVNDIRRSAKGGSERYRRAQELADELEARGVWRRDGMSYFPL